MTAIATTPIRHLRPRGDGVTQPWVCNRTIAPYEASTLHGSTAPARARGALSLQVVPASPATIPTTPGSFAVDARRSSPGCCRGSFARTSPASTVSATSTELVFDGNTGDGTTC